MWINWGGPGLAPVDPVVAAFEKNVKAGEEDGVLEAPRVGRIAVGERTGPEPAGLAFA